MVLCGKKHSGNGHEAGRQLLAQMYREMTGLDMPAIAVTSRGKPYFPDSHLHFSISHTRHFVFCALSERPIGIDAEEKNRTINLRLADKILSSSEQALYDASPDKQQTLLRFWVLKEAAAKCSGEGLQGFPNHTSFSPDDPRIQTISGCLVAVIED